MVFALACGIAVAAPTVYFRRDHDSLSGTVIALGMTDPERDKYHLSILDAHGRKASVSVSKEVFERARVGASFTKPAWSPWVEMAGVRVPNPQEYGPALATTACFLMIGLAAWVSLGARRMLGRHLWSESTLSAAGVQALRESSWASCDGYLVWILPIAALRSALTPLIDPVGVELGVAIEADTLPRELIDVVAQEVHRRTSFDVQDWVWRDRTLKCFASTCNPENTMRVLRALIATCREQGLVPMCAPMR